MKIIETSKGQILVDDQDYELLSMIRWNVTSHGYVSRNYLGRLHMVEYMHRLIYRLRVGPIPKGMMIDHKDRNKLNNTLDNLRLASKSQNACNMNKSTVPMTSKYRGVSWASLRSKWVVFIKWGGTKNQKRKGGGYFDNEIDAARRYDELAKEKHGEFANLNFPSW